MNKTRVAIVGCGNVVRECETCLRFGRRAARSLSCGSIPALWDSHNLEIRVPVHQVGKSG